MKPSPRFAGIFRLTLLVGAGLYFGATTPLYANGVMFDFNSLAAGAAIGNAATPGTITYYMNHALQAAGCIGCTVTVVGTAADRTWDGDGHVVGPSGHPLTLGTYGGVPSAISNAAVPTGVLGTTNNRLSGTVNTFLADTTDHGAQVGVGAHNEMYFRFSGFSISGAVSFDYEIFPCAVGGSCTNPPGFTLEAGTGTSGSDPLVTSFGSGGTQLAVTPSAGAPDGSSTRSPVSGASADTSKQWIGYYSTTSALNGATEVDFLDWPATIGIDNWTISWRPPNQVPEPGTLLLVGSGLAGLYLKRKRQLHS